MSSRVLNSAKIEENQRTIAQKILGLKLHDEMVNDHTLLEWGKIHALPDIIGSGSFGVINKAIYDDGEAEYALKTQIIDSDQSKTLDLCREISFQKLLNHPCILPLIGISISDSIPHYLSILTPLKWGSLSKVIQNLQNGHFNENPSGWNNTIKMKIIFGTATAILYLHSQQILHRDIKLENILIDNVYNPFLADLGMAKKNTSADMYQSKIAGTPAYHPPEFYIMNDYQYGPEVDIYAFAVVIGSILYEEMPWSYLGPSFDLINKIQLKFDQGKRPFELTGEFPFWNNLIARSWVSDPKARLGINDIITELMKPEALLPGANGEEMKRYMEELLSRTNGSVQNENGKAQSFRMKMKINDLEEVVAKLRYQLKEVTEENLQKTEYIEKLEKENKTLQSSINNLLADKQQQKEHFQAKVKDSEPESSHVPAVSEEEMTTFEKNYGSSKEVKSNKYSRLHFAAFIDDEAIASYLMSTGLDVNVHAKGNSTPLYVASFKNSTKVARLLLARGADVEAQDQNGLCPLHVAAAARAFEMAELLVNTGKADVHAQTREKKTPLFYAVQSNAASIAMLLISKGANVNARDMSGQSPVHIAAAFNSVDSLQILSENGGDLNALTNAEKESPLHSAAKNNSKDTAMLLVKKGVDINLKTASGKAPRNLASKAPGKDVEEYLKSIGAKKPLFG